MKRHKTHEHNLLVERMCDEFNDACTVKELALVAHIYIEYFVNELIVARFNDPSMIIDDGQLGSFNSKVTLLKALGTFNDALHVLANLELIQRIRNFYAHNLLLSGDLPEQVASRIKQLKYFEYGEICDYELPWSEHEDPLLTQLHVCGLTTANGLIELQETYELEVEAEAGTSNAG